jgi:hypothetical protein
MLYTKNSFTRLRAYVKSSSKSREDDMACTPGEAAKLISDAVPNIEKKRNRKTTRFQLSLVSLSKICERDVVDAFFLKNLASELLNLGWCMIQVENTRWGFIRKKSVDSWVRLSSKRFLQQD